MAVNLAVNVREALEGFPLATDIQCWLDSTVALHWLSDHGEYRPHSATLWCHVLSEENPADLASRGGNVSGEELWWKAPVWLGDPTRWPPNIVTQPCPESAAERKVQQ